MKKICKRADWVQVIGSNGAVRVCGWLDDSGTLGSLLDQPLHQIYHGEKAAKLRARLLDQDYSSCRVDSCPYLMMGEVKDILIEPKELPQYPEQLRLAFENECNYRCLSCTACERNAGKTKEQIEKDKDLIEERIKEALPYVKNLGANGMGELFCSKRTLKLLAEWEPRAPKEECEAWLETNGALFDEEHWKQIENLGQYYLGVTITVMSFDEATYQRLSGVNYPIEKIENNLRFVKSLREKNIINHLILGTVVYADNFRILPEFTRRCLEEFGADQVRLRPYDNWGAQNAIEELFMNIRNPIHPWYKEYKEVMKDPIFRDPRVLEQSGGNDAEENGGMMYALSYAKWAILTHIFAHTDAVIDKLPKKNLVIYGLGNFTKALIPILQQKNMEPEAIIDRYVCTGSYKGISVFNINETEGLANKKYVVLVTPIEKVLNIEKQLSACGIHGDIIPIWDMIDDNELKASLKDINGIK